MLDKIKRIILSTNRLKDIEQEFQSFLGSRNIIKPHNEALKIAIVYGIVGALWILLSDEILSRIVNNPSTYKLIQTYKGWLYVVITMVMIYELIKNRLILFQKAQKRIYEAYEELNAVHEEQLVLEEELRIQFDELQDSKDALSISDQRYELVLEGVNDGIWDWDIKKDIWYYSTGWKNYLGYKDEDINNNFQGWVKLINADDKSRVVKNIIEYLRSKNGIYEDTYELRCKDGSYRLMMSRGKALWDEFGNAIRFVGSHTDVTERKAMEGRLEFLAYFDTLTLLPNRAMFEVSVNKLIEAKRNLDSKFALAYIDIDNFKQINDTLGHTSGDLLLKYISDILKEQIKLPDFVARLSGDEFVIILDNVRDKGEISSRIDELLKYLRRPWKLECQEFFISFSMGITLFPEQGTDLTTLLKNADTAMFYVKERDKDDYCFYNDTMREKALAYTQMINELRHAIDNEEFILYYQPLVNLKDGEITGVEALIRWKHPEKGFISPMEFIPLAEETGYIYDIGKWVLRTACMQKHRLEEKGYQSIKMSVNLSGKRLTGDNLVSEISELLQIANTSCIGLQIEVTETAVMTDIDKAARCLKQLREMDIKIALDDFGTGYSSLTYLKKLPIDIVKMDREFINNISNKDENEVIVRSVIQLIHDLNLEVVAEGIEKKEQLDFLISHSCDMGQGYLFSRPIPGGELERILDSGKKYTL